MPLLRYRGIVRGMVPIPGRPVFDACILGGVVSLLNVSRVSSESSRSGTSPLLSSCCSVSSSAIELEAAEGLLVSEEDPLAGASYIGEAGPRGNEGEIGLVTSDLLGLSRGMGAFDELGTPFPVLRGRRGCGGKAPLFGDGGDMGEGELPASSPGGGA